MKKIILIIMALLLSGGCVNNSAKVNKTVELYFLSSDRSHMVTEKREINMGEDSLEAVINELLKGPTIPELKRAIPPEAALIDAEITGTVAIINMTSAFNEGSDVEKLWSRYTLISTLCSLPGVQKAKILVEGKEITSISTNEPLGAIGKDDIVLNSPQTDKDKTVVTLYFSDKQAMYLVPENRQVSVKEGEKIEQVIVNELIKGPVNKDFMRTLPAEVKVLSAETKERVCFVNLSREFISKSPGGSTSELVAIFSIVNSLCELDQVDKVQFLIEGQKIEVFGHSVFNEPFEKNESMLKQ